MFNSRREQHITENKVNSTTEAQLFYSSNHHKWFNSNSNWQNLKEISSLSTNNGDMADRVNRYVVCE